MKEGACLYYPKGDLSIREAQFQVIWLEEDKGFSKDIRDKILWLGEEFGELCSAYKHGDMAKVAEEAVDIMFFVLSIIEKTKHDAEIEFRKKMRKNWERDSVSTSTEQHFDRE